MKLTITDEEKRSSRSSSASSGFSSREASPARAKREKRGRDEGSEEEHWQEKRPRVDDDLEEKEKLLREKLQARREKEREGGN